jgi:hypothetical protein
MLCRDKIIAAINIAVLWIITSFYNMHKGKVAPVLNSALYHDDLGGGEV